MFILESAVEPYRAACLPDGRAVWFATDPRLNPEFPHPRFRVRDASPGAQEEGRAVFADWAAYLGDPTGEGTGEETRG